MRALFAVHIGETVGHLVRALAIADELHNRGIKVEIACSGAAKWLLNSWPIQYPHHPVSWAFSHNGMTTGVPSQSLYNNLRDANTDLLRVLKLVKPDIVVGFPGIFSVQAARNLALKHVSVLHGPYLSPVISLDKPSKTEEVVISFAVDFFNNCVNSVYEHLSATLGFERLTYAEYLRSENIFIPQPFLPLPQWPNFVTVPFIRASFGRPIELEDTILRDSCYVTFGSGNPCEIEPIVWVAESVFPKVIITNGRNRVRMQRSDTVSVSFVASSSLSGCVGAVISHGGIGTVGTFGEYGTPQLIIPTEVDQATMAIHAVRSGIAITAGLSSWAENPVLGRRLNHVSEGEITHAVRQLRDMKRGHWMNADGASHIADRLATYVDALPQYLVAA